MNAWSMQSPLDLSGKPAEVLNYWQSVYKAAPIYPRKAAERGVRGCAVFSYTISDTGKAKDIQLVRGIKERTFAKSARKALQKYRWEATDINKEKQAVITEATISFSTDGERFACDAAEAEKSKKRNTTPKCRPTTGSRVGRKC